MAPRLPSIFTVGFSGVPVGSSVGAGEFATVLPLVPSASPIIGFSSISHSSSATNIVLARLPRVFGTGALAGSLVRRNTYRDANSRRGRRHHLEVRYNIGRIRIRAKATMSHL